MRGIMDAPSPRIAMRKVMFIKAAQETGLSISEQLQCVLQRPESYQTGKRDGWASPGEIRGASRCDGEAVRKAIVTGRVVLTPRTRLTDARPALQSDAA